MAESPFQSLYRRFRPQRFEEVRGQDHVTVTLRNAVRSATVAHAYLFSGPRGTGKTSTARILAKALNCGAPEDGEPCGRCDSCRSVTKGSSFDVHELDAASNNGVEAMRDLVSRVALGTPGRWKVYIVDEVHMLSTAASNALLKTLEEPPAHVVFVLATTDPQKVLPTITSRTQHFEFRLLSGEVLSGLVADVSAAAGLDVPVAAQDLAVRRGHGSARDALSVLDQVAAAGVVEDDMAVLDELTEALSERDSSRALLGVAEAIAAGRDPQRLSTDLVEYLRQGFLAVMAPELVTLADAARDRVAEHAHRLGTPALVRAMEGLGRAQVEMRDALDPRVNLEVTLIRLTRPEADDSPAALLERIDRVERRLAAGSTPGSTPRPVLDNASPVLTGEAFSSPTRPPFPRPAAPLRTESPIGHETAPGAARPTLGALKRQGGSVPEPEQAGRVTPGVAQPGPAAWTSPDPGGAQPESGPPDAETAGLSSTRSLIPAAPVALPDVDEMNALWKASILPRLEQKARSRYRAGRFVAVDSASASAVYALPNATHRSYCEETVPDVASALSLHFGFRVRLELVVDAVGAGEVVPGDGPPGEAAREMERESADDPLQFEVVAGEITSVEDQLLQAFPGAEEVGP